MICDSDETIVTTIPTTTESSIVTTLPTTTTLVGVCTDTDGGENWHVKGITTGFGVIVPADATQPDVYAYISREDICSSNRTLDEYYCADRILRVIHIDCDITPGQVCRDGQCVPEA